MSALIKSNARPAIAWIALLFLTICNAFIGSQEGLYQQTLELIIAFCISGLSLFTLIVYWPWKKSLRIIVPILLLQNLLFLPMLPGDDVNRYAWEGLVLNHQFNPYQIPPNDPQLAEINFYWHDQINHPDKTAIYPPGMLLLFKGLATINFSPHFFKICALVTSLLATLSLLPLLQRTKRHPKWALLFGIHPLVLTSFAGEGHLDIYMLTAMIWTLTAFFSKRYALMWLALALVFHTKYTGILLLPFLINRASLKSIAILIPTIVLPFLAFSPIDGIFTSLKTFSTEMHFNGLLYELLWNPSSDPQHISLLCGLAFLFLAAIIRLCNSHPIEGGLALTTALLLCSSNVHFWYATWLLPFLVFIPQRALLYWTFSIGVTFITTHNYVNGGVWEITPVYFGLEYIPLIILLGWSLFRFRLTPQSIQDDPARSSVSTTSVVIPVMNDVESLRKALDSLQACAPAPEQVIVAHAGNDEETPALCETYNALCIPSPAGRGNQIATGIQHALNDIILIAHADMTFEPGLFNDIPRALNSSGRIGGAVGSRFSSQKPFVLLIGQLNRMRATWGGLSFGDQAQFFRRDALTFPAQPLMEDVELSMRLKAYERPLFLDGGIVVSDRSWKKESNTRRALHIILLVAQYLSERRLFPERLDPEKYYARYYKRSLR